MTYDEADERSEWFAADLTMADEPLIVSLLKYRLLKDRHPAPGWGNLISSRTWNGKQLPILDLDFDHVVVDSTTEGHHHLFINVEMGQAKWTVLILVLWWTGVIEMGNAVWSLRRGQTFVRAPGLRKTEAEAVKPTYGWFKKL